MELEKNISLVHPAYFIIRGFVDIPNIKYYFVFLFFIYIVSVIGNTLVMIIIILDHTLRSPKYMVVFNLALTDLLSSSALVPKVIDIFLFNHPYIPFNECIVFMFFCFTLLSMQALNLVALSYDRLMAIIYPLHYQVKVTHKRMLTLIICFWLYTMSITFTSSGLLTRVSFCKSVVINSYFCDHGPLYQLGCNDITPNRAIGGLAPVLILWLPLAFILISYCCIAYALIKISTVHERLKAIKTCTGHLSLVAIYFLPTMIVYIFGSKTQPNVRIINLSLAAVVPPMLNPIIYVFQTQEIQQSFKKLLKIKGQSKIVTKN
ncbi:olfactory receptor 2AP1-like [Parambassis ranga]|uniref:Olfactory receptor 2AP1-like n=1 Tax=Parambassis ranga TaxID=210632 RepID=A0A6P7JR61_9TELE|nr:olfactory receptor 2AP1-like [Parambassis ranga]